MLRKLLMLSVIVALSSCAANAPIDPKNLQEYTDRYYFELPTPLKYSEKRGIGYVWEQGLAAGIYKPKYQDKKGYFFWGPERAVCLGSPICGEFGGADGDGFENMGGEGGIWVSKENANDVRIFGVFAVREEDKQRNQNAGVIINSLINKDIGKYFIQGKNEKFSQVLLGTKRQE